MVRVSDINVWSFSPSMLFGTTPKITYACGQCGAISSCRIPIKAIENHKQYVICPFCGEVNDTTLKV